LIEEIQLNVIQFKKPDTIFMRHQTIKTVVFMFSI